MWRRRVLGACGMPKGMDLTAGCLQTLRTVYIREHRTPVVIQTGERKYPAVLAWTWRSNVYRHLVLRILPPEMPLVAQSFDDLDACVEETNDGTIHPDYAFGRLFLRPYNVAQLLTVLHGWQDKIVIEREHAALRLEQKSVPPSTNARPRASEAKVSACHLSSFLLSGHFTIKSSSAEAANTQHSNRRTDEAPLSFYNLDDKRTIELPLKDADLVLLTSHLEAVLRDYFGIEHRHHAKRMQAALDVQRRRLQSYSARQPRRTDTPGRNVVRYLSHDVLAAEQEPVLPNGQGKARIATPAASVRTAAPTMSSLIEEEETEQTLSYISELAKKGPPTEWGTAGDDDETGRTVLGQDFFPAQATKVRDALSGEALKDVAAANASGSRSSSAADPEKLTSAHTTKAPAKDVIDETEEYEEFEEMEEDVEEVEDAERSATSLRALSKTEVCSEGADGVTKVHGGDELAEIRSREPEALGDLEVVEEYDLDGDIAVDDIGDNTDITPPSSSEKGKVAATNPNHDTSKPAENSTPSVKVSGEKSKVFKPADVIGDRAAGSNAADTASDSTVDAIIMSMLAKTTGGKEGSNNLDDSPTSLTSQRGAHERNAASAVSTARLADGIRPPEADADTHEEADLADEVTSPSVKREKSKQSSSKKKSGKKKSIKRKSTKSAKAKNLK